MLNFLLIFCKPLIFLKVTNEIQTIISIDVSHLLQFINLKLLILLNLTFVDF